MTSDKKLIYARDISVGDLLIDYYDNQPDMICSALFVLSVEDWSYSPLELQGRKFTVWNLLHEERYEYRWDDEPMVFDEVRKINP